MPILETPVVVDDLALIRDTLESCHMYLQATDLANAQVNLEDVRYRPLTREVERCLTRVKGLLSQALLDEYDDGRERSYGEPSGQEPEEPLPSNPLGQKAPRSRRS